MVPETGLAYVPIFGDGIHGRNPNPRHLLCVIDLEKRAHVGDIDLRPYIAPHTLKLGPDGLIYITCENSAKVVVIDPTTNKVVGRDRLRLDQRPSPDHLARRPAPLHRERGGRHRLGDRPAEPETAAARSRRRAPLAGIAISPDGSTVVAVDDAEPTLFLIDTARDDIRTRCGSKDVPKAAQIARYAPDNSLLGVTSLNSDTVSLIDPSFRARRPRSRSAASRWTWRSTATNCSSPARATARCTSSTFRRGAKSSFAAGKGCESLGFF